MSEDKTNKPVKQEKSLSEILESYRKFSEMSQFSMNNSFLSEKKIGLEEDINKLKRDLNETTKKLRQEQLQKNEEKTAKEKAHTLLEELSAKEKNKSYLTENL